MKSLPGDIILRIYTLLSALDALALSGVNRSFHGLYQESSEVQYHVECQLAGVDDNPKCHLPISTRLEMLREREEAWRKISPKSVENVYEPHPSSDFYDFSRCHYLIGTTGLDTRKANGVMSYELYTKNKERWSTFHVDEMLGFSCCIDEHDLLICIACSTQPSDVIVNAHIFQHSTLSPHPEATEPVFPIRRYPRHIIDTAEDSISVRSEIAGDHLIIAVTSTEIGPAGVEEDYTRLFILNWRTGEMCHVHWGPSVPGIAMLCHDIFVFPNLEKGCLDIYHIPTVDPGSMGSIHLIGRLNLPEPSNGNYSSIQCRAASNPVKDGSFPAYIPSIPFIDSSKNALIFFHIWVDSNSYDSSFKFTMVVHRHALLNLLPPDSKFGSTPYFEVSWEEWGPDRTHWFVVGGGKKVRMTSVNGQRYVYNDAIERHGGQNMILLDFNPFNVKRALKQNTILRNPHSVQRKITIDNPVFANPFECRLPYLRILSEEKYHYGDGMINDNAIIAKVGLHVFVVFILQILMGVM
ncbi:hypothetical protein AN958_08997 [Leucoagaricus sp. SymC.cos]|nr:hypothetical protein AN958_08997 [Leucoagaricus sp. SymC.cos]